MQMTACVPAMTAVTAMMLDLLSGGRFLLGLGVSVEAKKIKDLYPAGKKEKATALVPDALVDEAALCGPRADGRTVASVARIGHDDDGHQHERHRDDAPDGGIGVVTRKRDYSAPGLQFTKMNPLCILNKIGEQCCSFLSRR